MPEPLVWTLYGRLMLTAGLPAAFVSFAANPPSGRPC